MTNLSNEEKLKLLAAKPTYAMRCHKIAGDPRENNESVNDYRNIFMSDRDRILYCKSFLRLAGKTQVYAPSMSDHQRTRLTHTLEVSQIARTISSALGLDCDLTEAIALGHDIGHTPFGHAGERMLHEIMSPCKKANSLTCKHTTIYKLSEDSKEADKYRALYGFKHNLQSVRCIVEDLESKSKKWGLDLTNYTLWGIMNHSSFDYKAGKVETEYISPMFYRDYMKFWSKAAQMHHDLEDAIRGHAMPESKVIILLSKLKDLMDKNDKNTLSELEKDWVSREYLIANTSKIIVNTLVSTLIRSTKDSLLYLIDKYGKENDSSIDVSDVFLKGDRDPEISRAISYDCINKDDTSAERLINDFKEELSKTVLYTYNVQRSDSKGKYIIKNLFEAYYTNPQQLPDSALKNLYKALQEKHYKFTVEKPYYKIDSDELRREIATAVTEIRKNIDAKQEMLDRDILIMRIICDHIAGMTDSFAISEYEKLYG